MPKISKGSSRDSVDSIINTYFCLCTLPLLLFGVAYQRGTGAVCYITLNPLDNEVPPLNTTLESFFDNNLNTLFHFFSPRLPPHFCLVRPLFLPLTLQNLPLTFFVFTRRMSFPIISIVKNIARGARGEEVIRNP